MLQLPRSVLVVRFILHAARYFYLIINGACLRVPTQPGRRPASPAAGGGRLSAQLEVGPSWLFMFISFFNGGEHRKTTSTLSYGKQSLRCNQKPNHVHNLPPHRFIVTHYPLWFLPLRRTRVSLPVSCLFVVLSSCLSCSTAPS